MKARCVRSLEEAAAGSRRRQPADQGLLIEQPRRGDRAVGLLGGSRAGIDLDYGTNAELQGRSPVATSWLRAGRLRFPWAVAQGYLLSPLRGLESFVTEALMQCRSSLNRLSHCAVRDHFASSTCCNFCTIRAEQHWMSVCREFARLVLRNTSPASHSTTHLL